MSSGKKILSLIICASLYSSMSLAQESQFPNLGVANLPSLDDQTRSQASEFYNRNKGDAIRPEACPLESKKHKDILSKIENIKTLFKENCLDSDQNLLDQMLSGATSIQSELDKVVASASSDASDTPLSDASTTSIAGVTISGQQIAGIVGNINQIYKQRSCKALNNNQSFLENAAGVISDFAKIGLLVPNSSALIVAGGGIALSSILLIVDNLFKRRFNFEKTEDRQSFIKLNCAFYDVRRDIEKSGFLDVATEAHKRDREQTTIIVKNLEAQAKQLEQALAESEKKVAQAKKAYVEQKVGELEDFTKAVETANTALEVEVKDVTQKMEVVRQLTLLRQRLKDGLTLYTERKLGQIPLLDDNFKKMLEQLDSVRHAREYRKLLNKPLEKFNTTFYGEMKFHVSRLKVSLQTMQNNFTQSWEKEIRINGMKLPEYVKELAKDYAEKAKILDKHYTEMKLVETRLKRILDEQGFSSTDDGSENIVNILADYDKIAEQIYGDFGLKFLQYTTKKAFEQNKKFISKFKTFAKDYLDLDKKGDANIYKVPEAANVNELRIKFACQDAKPYRRIWKYADGLAQQGYDFVATNGDLFHSDIPRIFMGKSGGRRFGIHNFLSKFEKIQMHYKSALFANKVIKKLPVDAKAHKKYLKKKYLGRAMLYTHYSMPYAQMLQQLIEKYDCSKVTGLE